MAYSSSANRSITTSSGGTTYQTNSMLTSVTPTPHSSISATSSYSTNISSSSPGKSQIAGKAGGSAAGVLVLIIGVRYSYIFHSRGPLLK